MIMGILMKVLFVVVAITIMAFAWKEAVSILPAKIVTYVKVGGVLLSIIFATLLFLL